MNKEKLKQSNDLRAQIDGLIEHRKHIMKWWDEVINGRRTLSLTQYEEKDIDLRRGFLLLPVPKLMELYLSELEKEIEIQEKQFEAL